MEVVGGVHGPVIWISHLSARSMTSRELLVRRENVL